MTHEILRLEEGQHDSTHAATQFSQSAFADPRTYLQILKNNFAQIDSASYGNDLLQKEDLINFVKSTNDPEAKQAAEFALKHLNTLSTEDRISEKTYDGSYGISNNDLNISMDIYDGKLWPYIKNETAFPAVAAAAFGAGTIGNIIGTASIATTAEAGSLLALSPIGLGAITVATGMFAGYWGYETYKAYNRVNDFAADTKIALAGPAERT
ncbi:hypothetical protein KBI23_05600 [bacterium]|nr:hypothetical protein [bacterium]MBP9810602.1 hypothetical protein [bacterium]